MNNNICEKKYNFGIRKPCGKCKIYLQDSLWKNNLINKWIFYEDKFDNTLVFFKHIFLNNRVIQIIYSGNDICGDGVYILYKVNTYTCNEEFYIEPDIYELVFGSFETRDYLKKLLTEKYISEKEYDFFKNSSYNIKREYCNTLKEMRIQKFK